MDTIRRYKPQIALGAAGLVLVVAAFLLGQFIREIDRTADAMALDPGPQASLLYDRHGKLMFSLFAEDRVLRSLDGMSPSLVSAVLAAEDRHFYSHHGVDVPRIAAAAWRNLVSGRVRQGASTITQQLVRAQALGRERTWSRKWREVLLSLRVDRRFPKSQILETYLNRIYLGDGYFGVQAASRGYFGKDASELTAPESAMLAGIIRCPSSCSPRLHPERAKARRDLVLNAMVKTGALDREQAERARALPVVVQKRFDINRPEGRILAGDVGGLYFVSAVRRQLVQRFGEDLVLRGGLKVYTTLDLRLQKAAEDAVVKRLDQLNAREAKTSRTGTLDNPLEGSLVAIDPRNGHVLALVGGRDFNESPFDRATMAKRQPGSAFKPIFFAAALEQGYVPSAVVDDLDTPIAAVGGAWLPGDDHGDMESYTLREALTISSNRAAARLLQRVGVQNAIYYAHRLGITAPLPAVPSLALGTAEVTLLELTSAYGVFANKGVLAPATMITRVEDAAGEVLWEAHDASVQAIQPETAFLMSSMLADVVNRGTGAGVRSAGFRLAAGGKTGTTDSYSDAWFIGYTPGIVAGVWFGRDMPEAIMRRGYAATVAVPAWAAFMKQATAGQKSEWFTAPPTLQRVAICALTGMLATEDCRDAAENGEGAIIEDYYRRGQPRPEPCTYHSAYAAVADRVQPQSPAAPATTSTVKRPLVPVAVFGPGWSDRRP